MFRHTSDVFVLRLRCQYTTRPLGPDDGREAPPTHLTCPAGRRDARPSLSPWRCSPASRRSPRPPATARCKHRREKRHRRAGGGRRPLRGHAATERERGACFSANVQSRPVGERQAPAKQLSLSGACAAARLHAELCCFVHTSHTRVFLSNRF